MSATLRSFDFDNDSIAFRKIRSPKLKSLDKRDHIDSGFNENGRFDDDIEFDDTRMDNDDMKPNRSFNDENISNNRENGQDSFHQRDYVIRDTTTKVPLKDSPHTSSVNRNSNKASTPDTLDRINRYRSKNGTPLKLPPLTSNQFSESDNESPSLPIEEKAEDSLIKHRKLISDDNKFSPGNTRVSLKKTGFDTPNAHNIVSPPRSMNRSTNEAIITPPSNLKVRPFIFGSTSKKLPFSSFTRKGLPEQLRNAQPSGSRNDADIEFDSSDVDGEEEDHGATRSRLLSSTSRINASISNQLPKPPSGVSQNIQINSPDREQNFELREKSVYEQYVSPANPKSGSKVEDIGNSSDREVHQAEKYGDISRAEILEKINSTINSLMEKDKFASSPSKANAGDVLPRNIDKEIAEAESSDETPEEIINELDSFFSGNKSNIGNRRSLVFNHKSPSKSFSGNNETDPILNGKLPKSTPIRTHYSRLSGKYARQIMHRRKSENVSNKENSVKPILEDSNDISLNSKWPTSKWLKLNKVLQLGKIAKKDIINSEVLIQKLGCDSKRELKQRVEFLVQFNESRKVRTPKKKVVSNIKKNNISPKSSKSEKRFQII
mmetsp:Transcript_9178/g.9083  ORF Transcript_9178/g.9083 Transcript_9178/m.9083 type:complete len:606 (+) Transcript_9178:1424-3241(+)